jgi:ATP-dependent Lon protease
MATAIVSALRKEPVLSDVAMTGEITLSGLVLPVGGIREKSLAARRHGIKSFVLPALNAQDLTDLPEEVNRDLKFFPVRTLEEVLRIALPSHPAIEEEAEAVTNDPAPSQHSPAAARDGSKF